MYSAAILLAMRTDRLGLVVVTEILITRVFLVFENAITLSTELIAIERTSSGDRGIFGFSDARPKKAKSCVSNLT